MKESLKIYPNLLPITGSFKGILLDAYGVFWRNNDYGLFPGSKEVMEHLLHSRKVVGILSNTTQLASKEIQKLERHGLIQGKHFHFLITSGEVARSIFLNEILPFATPRKTFCLLGDIHPRFFSHEALFKETDYSETSDIDQADFVYISIPHINGEDQTDPELFVKEIAKVRSKNLPMVCANPDMTAYEGKPPKAVVRQGSIAKMYEEMGGQVFYIGKPYAKVYTAALDQFRIHNITNPEEILMVGDTPETDIRGARSCGMHSALVMKTGVMADRVSKKGLDAALKELPPSDTPHYGIERLSNETSS